MFRAVIVKVSNSRNVGFLLWDLEKERSTDKIIHFEISPEFSLYFRELLNFSSQCPLGNQCCDTVYC